MKWGLSFSLRDVRLQRRVFRLLQRSYKEGDLAPYYRDLGLKCLTFFMGGGIVDLRHGKAHCDW